MECALAASQQKESGSTSQAYDDGAHASTFSKNARPARISRKGSWQAHLGDSRQGEREQAATDSHHHGVEDITESNFLQQALAIAASSYPSPLNKYEMTTSPKFEASAQQRSERAQE